MLRRMSVAERFETLRDVAAIIREPLRFGIRRTIGGRDVGRYHLRESGLAVHLRHDVLDDLSTLVQTFGQDHYVPPAGAEQALAELGRPIRAMDLGANIGMFGAWLLSRWPDAAVVAYEADPGNARILSLTVAANSPPLAWEACAAAAGTADGEVRFVAGRGAHSRLANDDEPDAVVVPVRDVLARASDTDLLKIDIEGAEWELLADPRFAGLPARVVALEYHAERCPSSDPASAAGEHLAQAGYRTAAADLTAPPGHGMVWGWR
jgi:FkbM family methyltransferase